MTLLEDKKKLAIIIALLVAIKFIIFPIFAWQNQKLKDTSLLAKQLSKGEHLVANQAQIRNVYVALKKARQQTLSQTVFFEPTETSFQLNVQKRIELLLEKFELKARTSSWLNNVELGQLQAHKLEISLSGPTKGFIGFLTELESNTPKIAIYNFSGNISRMSPNNAKLGKLTGKVIIQVWRKSAEGEQSE
jgi:hypothetical protein